MIDEDYMNEKLEWVKYRIEMLDQIEDKLIKMKQLAEFARDFKLSSQQIESINTKILKFQQEVIALDEQSRTFRLDTH